jgi:hypothetical protein
VPAGFVGNPCGLRARLPLIREMSVAYPVWVAAKLQIAIQSVSRDKLAEPRSFMPLSLLKPELSRFRQCGGLGVSKV